MDKESSPPDPTNEVATNVVPQIISSVSSNWTPEVIVNLASELAWPIVLLILGLRFKNSFGEGFKNFFNKNNVTELSAGTSGFSAKFETSQQDSGLKSPQSDKSDITENLNKEDLIAAQEERSTQYSLELLKTIKAHVESLDAPESEKINILSKEVSIYQASMVFLEVTYTLYSSQYKLFNEYLYPNNEITDVEAEKYFYETVKPEPGKLEGWDSEKYFAYPLAAGFLSKSETGIRLTKFGASYVRYIRNNPGVAKYLLNV